MNDQIVNCLLALEHWSRVRPETVNLNHWRCGTQACFGGHLATWPEFKAMGVMRSQCLGAPYMLVEGMAVTPYSVAKMLFGEPAMFAGRDGCELDWRFSANQTEYEVIVHRLEAQIETLSNKHKGG